MLRGAGVTIGKGVVINEGLTLVGDLGSESNLIIKDRVAIGPNVTLVLTSHPNNSRLRDHKEMYPFIEVSGRVILCNDSWIGAGAIILPDTVVGESSVIGAGAVVTLDVPPYCVVAGVPAKVIKKISFPEVTQ